MWVQPHPVVLTVKPWSSPHGGSCTTASLVSQNPNIPSASTQQLPILPKPTFNSRTPSSQVPNATAAIFFFFLLYYYSVRTNRQAQRIRSTAELGLLSLLFVLSTDSAAVFSFAVLCILSINAMRRLAASVDKLSNVVSREVPGTLSSLKLSGVKINNLAKQLVALSSPGGCRRLRTDVGLLLHCRALSGNARRARLEEKDNVNFERCLCGALGVGLEAHNQD